jgi:hypothetical protein
VHLPTHVAKYVIKFFIWPPGAALGAPLKIENELAIVPCGRCFLQRATPVSMTVFNKVLKASAARPGPDKLNIV